MDQNKYGPHINFIKLLLVGILLIIIVLTIPIIIFGLGSTGDSFTSSLVILFITFCLFAMIISFVLGDFKTYSIETDAVVISNLITQSNKRILFTNIIEVENYIAGANPRGFKDFKITLKYNAGQCSIYFPSNKQKDATQFLNLLGERIGKNKIKYMGRVIS